MAKDNCSLHEDCDDCPLWELELLCKVAISTKREFSFDELIKKLKEEIKEFERNK